ncbi:hypothetical protein [Streptomyces sp. NPDC054940]
MTAAIETADAVTRDRLRGQLRELTGRVLAEVRITRVRWPEGLRWVAMALADHRPYARAATRRREVPLAEGALHHDIAILLRDAFPHADWSVAQDYDVTTGVLREHVVRLPACLRGDAL